MPKLISLIGSDMLIGRCFDEEEKGIIKYSSSELDWNKPDKTARVITKGNPDAYVICYSALDEAENVLLEILKVIKKVAKRNKAKIIGFVTKEIFSGYSERKVDENTEPFAVTESGKAQILYENKLLDHTNAINFRIDRIWGPGFGIINSFIKRIGSSEGLEVLRDEVFNITSASSIVSAVKRAIERDLVLYYNLVDSGEVREDCLTKIIQEAVVLEKHPTRRKMIEGGKSLVLDGLCWETVSMTKMDDALKRIQKELPILIRDIYATK